MDNRFDYIDCSKDQAEILKMTRKQFQSLYAFLDEALPEGRGKEYAMKALEESDLWASKAICKNDGGISTNAMNVQMSSLLTKTSEMISNLSDRSHV